jgi:N-acetylglucosamine-6-phosphate deacetylase
MTMHLEGPWLTTTGKKRGKQKWATAEAKRLAQKRQAEWDRKLVEFDKMAPGFSTGPYTAPRRTMADFMPRTPPGRETVAVPSQDTGWVACVRATDMTYSGSKMIGIGQMHKSSAVPVFSDNEAKEISSMRR